MTEKGFFKRFTRAPKRESMEMPVDDAAIQKDIDRVPGAEISAKLDPWWWLVVAVVGILIILLPLLVQLIWWYFAAPVVIKTIGQYLHISALANYHSNAIFLAILGLVICYGAYMTEIFRAGIQSIHKGQMEAARSLGMTYMQAMQHVIVPQAIRVVLPPVGNEFIMLIKDTSLVSAVAVADLTRRGREYMGAHFNPIEVWTLVALLYLILTLLSARLISWLENRRRFER